MKVNADLHCHSGASGGVGNLDFQKVAENMPDPIPLRHLSEHLPELFALSRSSLYNLHTQGKMPKGFKVGKSYYFRRDEIIAWLRSRVEMPPEEEDE